MWEAFSFHTQQNLLLILGIVETKSNQTPIEHGLVLLETATLTQLQLLNLRHLWICHEWDYIFLQFVDDILDFTSSSKVMGKPALNDLKSGLATAPVLFAAEEYPELSPLIQRRFQNDGDVKLAQKLVFQSRGIERTRELAAEHASLAAEKVWSQTYHDLPGVSQLDEALIKIRGALQLLVSCMNNGIDKRLALGLG